jgi:hypothetical protein
MGILFKTYQRRHQLHVCNETWTLPDKKQLEEVLQMFRKEDLSKAKITPTATAIEIELNAMIVNCRNMADLKKKFGILAELKERYQKIIPQKKKPVKK